MQGNGHAEDGNTQKHGALLPEADLGCDAIAGRRQFFVFCPSWTQEEKASIKK